MTDYSGVVSSQFQYFKLRNNNIWFETLPIIEIETNKSADNLSGEYSITIPNIQGGANGLFKHFDNQEIHIVDFQTNTMERVMVGQINSIETSNKNILTLNGRGLSGHFTDKKLTDSFDNMRGDYILCDPTFGAIPNNYNNITTWNGFTEDYDKFDYWKTGYWGAKPAYAEIIDNELEVEGTSGTTRTVTSTEEYSYHVIEFRAKVDTASDSVKIGLTNTGRTNYVEFELKTASVECNNADDISSQTSSVSSSITQTDYNYYRIEWSEQEVRFFVNGVLEVTETSNVPTGKLKPFFEMVTTSSTLTLDYMKVITLTNIFDRYLVKNKIMIDVINDICEIGNNSSSFTFYVDDNHDFNAFIKSTESSGKSFGQNSTLYTNSFQQISNIDLKQEAKDLYNSVRVRGGEELTEVSAPDWTDQFIGDGTTSSYILGYKAQKPITLLEVNSVAKTEDTDFEVTYGKEHTVIKFNTAPANTHTINVRYNYFTPIISINRNESSIQEYGVERMYDVSDENITSTARARKFGMALLETLSDPRNVISITTFLDPTLNVGKTINVDAPDFNINNTEYEIIEIKNQVGSGRWISNLTLITTNIDTNAEIIKEILQILKDLQNRGDTTEVVVDERSLSDSFESTEKIEYKNRWICDSFIIGSTADNSKLGMGEIISRMDDNTDWTPSEVSLSDNSDTDYIKVSTKSVKVDWSNDTEGYLSQDITADYTDYATGTIGLWCYSNGNINNIKIRLTDSSSNYSQWNYIEVRGGTLQSGWNYLTFDIDSPDDTSGTLDFSDISNLKILIEKDNTNTCYLNYLTISKSESIGLNGMGFRYIDDTYTEL